MFLKKVTRRKVREKARTVKGTKATRKSSLCLMTNRTKRRTVAMKRKKLKFLKSKH